MSDISKNIKRLRIARDMSQAQLADALKVTRQTISNWERGSSNPDIEILLSICRVLKVEANDLLYPHRERNNTRLKLIPVPVKFIFFSLIGYLFSFIIGGRYIGVPLLYKIMGGGQERHFFYYAYWGLFLIVGYISFCICFLSEYFTAHSSPCDFPESIGPSSSIVNKNET